MNKGIINLKKGRGREDLDNEYKHIFQILHMGFYD